MSAQVEILEQTDVVEGQLTRLIARLLEIGATTARCRVQLLSTDETGGTTASELLHGLEATLGEATGAVLEVQGAPEPRRAITPAREPAG